MNGELGVFCQKTTKLQQNNQKIPRFADSQKNHALFPADLKIKKPGQVGPVF
jgi:hypothetical protein